MKSEILESIALILKWKFWKCRTIWENEFFPSSALCWIEQSFWELTLKNARSAKYRINLIFFELELVIFINPLICFLSRIKFKFLVSNTSGVSQKLILHTYTKPKRWNCFECTLIIQTIQVFVVNAELTFVSAVQKMTCNFFGDISDFNAHFITMTLVLANIFTFSDR